MKREPLRKPKYCVTVYTCRNCGREWEFWLEVKRLYKKTGKCPSCISPQKDPTMEGVR